MPSRHLNHLSLLCTVSRSRRSPTGASTAVVLRLRCCGCCLLSASLVWVRTTVSTACALNSLFKACNPPPQFDTVCHERQCAAGDNEQPARAKLASAVYCHQRAPNLTMFLNRKPSTVTQPAVGSIDGLRVTTERYRLKIPVHPTQTRSHFTIWG